MRRDVKSNASAICSVLVLAAAAPLAKAADVTLTPIATNFNNPVGIDHHQPTNQVIMSVNYPAGLPHNFELVAANGTRSPFSDLSGFTNEVKIGAVRKGCCQGGFEAGELLTGTGVPGVIARITPDGSSVQNPWVTLPGETGLMRGSLFQDRFCAFGGDLIVVTTVGSVWRVTSAGVPSLLASLGTHLEGVTTVPDDPSKYGPWAGKILAGAEDEDRIYSIAANGDTAAFDLGISPEDIEVIPANQNFFGVDFSGSTLWGAPPSEFTGMVGDILVSQESPIPDGGAPLWHVRWTGTGSDFQATVVAEVGQWEHITFSTAGLPNILPIDPVELSPITAENPAGTDHTVTARIRDLGGHVPEGRLFSFTVTAGPNLGQVSDPGECAVNTDCTTDVSDEVSWTYTSNGQLGTDTIAACFSDDECTEHCATATKVWVDGAPPAAACIATVNPHGRKIPPAGSSTLPGAKGGQNEDGYYRLTADDDVDPNPQIFVIDTGSGVEFGPFASDTNIKYTEANGATPSQKKIGSEAGQAGAVAWHITGRGDAAVYSVDSAGSRSPLVFCLVPPLPK